MADLDPQQKIALINENLQEVLRPDIIENAIVKEDRPLVIYWGNVSRKHSTTNQHTNT
jgi:tyrosyl-tRNA synthetase